MEPLTFARASRAQRAIRSAAATRAGAKVFAPTAQRIDAVLYRLTRGRHTFVSLLTGLPVVMLTTTGAHSGVERTVPLLGFPTNEGLVVIASNFGRQRHPAWYHNLRANPAGRVTVAGRMRSFRAVLAVGERRARIWQEGLKIYPGWADYERRATREIMVFVLELG